MDECVVWGRMYTMFRKWIGLTSVSLCWRLVNYNCSQWGHIPPSPDKNAKVPSHSTCLSMLLSIYIHMIDRHAEGIPLL